MSIGADKPGSEADLQYTRSVERGNLVGLIVAIACVACLCGVAAIFIYPAFR